MIIRKLRSFSAVLALVALSTVFVMTAQPSPAAAHGKFQNGCTGVPDSGQDFNFHKSCDSHDLCYHYKRLGTGEVGRKKCDVQFLDNMRAWCRANTVNKSVRTTRGRDTTYRNPRDRCNSRAKLYYNGVRVLGKKHF
ncbi:MAG: phospholipase A2 [Aquihabitans sp.]